MDVYTKLHSLCNLHICGRFQLVEPGSHSVVHQQPAEMDALAHTHYVSSGGRFFY